MEKIFNGLTSFRNAIHAINEKYKTPRIQVTPMVNF